MLTRRNLIQALSVASPVLPWSGALAQGAYPHKPVTLLVPQPAGGDADAFCRTLQPRLQEYLGQAVVIDNRGGAAGNIGTAAGARAAADGYTVTFVNQGTLSINPHLYPNPGYTLEQFVPVTQLASIDLVICAHPSVKAHHLKDLLEAARQTPASFNYGTAGNGSANHLAGEMLKSMAGVDLTHVPYKGGGPAITAALGGEIQLVLAFPLAALPHIKAGKLKALAVTGAKRAAALPDVPTVAESGVKDYEFSSWFGLACPKGTPADVLKKINDAAAFALRTPEIADKLLAGMTRPVISGTKEFSALIARESAQWSRMIKQLGIKID